MVLGWLDRAGFWLAKSAAVDCTIPELAKPDSEINGR